MIDTIYYETQVEEHPRSIELFKRFPHASRIPCRHYKEVFNPIGQNFRLQKKKPSLILAKNSGKLVHPVPNTYGIGGKKNYYFSHMLNCLYDCRYCFLQGMYPSSNYLLFVNYEDFFDEIKTKTEDSPNQKSWFFSGYDCDSMALEKITGFVSSALPFFSKYPSAQLELRTKSVATQVLKGTTPLSNVITAFSFTPQEISDQLEKNVPPVSSRIKAMKEIADEGWQVGVRLDPLIDCADFEIRYAKLIRQIFTTLDSKTIHSVSLGPFRLPEPFFKKMENLYPEEPIFASKLQKRGKTVSYHREIENQQLETCKQLLFEYLPPQKLFFCEPDE